MIIDNSGQTSAEMILLIGIILIIVIIVGKFISDISNSINLILKNLITVSSESILNKI